MNYIYDIYLNLNESLYDFFDWNKNDKIKHIKKIPIFKVDEETLKTFISNEICIKENLLLQIYNRTDIWNQDSKISYCSLFSDENTILAIEFNKFGKSIKKSYLLVDEELEIIEIIHKHKEKDIDYTIIKKEKNRFKTRKQISEENFITNELKNIEQNKLNYIYYECFGKQEKNTKIILENINKIKKNTKTYKILYYILKLTATTKK